MELQSLGTNFLPDTVVEGYESLVWADRYREAGDFVLKTSLIEETMADLQLGTMCSIKGGWDIKIVESHVIEKDPDGVNLLTVTGRSFETFYENRIAHENQVRMFTLDGDVSTPGTPNYDWNLATTGAAAATYAEQILRYKSKTNETPDVDLVAVNFVVDPTAALQTGIPRRYITVQIGTVYERVIEILAMDNLGIRSTPPVEGTSTLMINLFKGKDVSDKVILSTSAGHFQKSSYAWSTRDYKNAAIAHSEWDWTYNLGTSGTNLNRRYGWVDATDITKAAAPAPGATNLDEKELQSRIATYLGEHKQKVVFSGEVSFDIPYKFMRDYNLGDILKVVGDYGVNQDMRVTEYIQTEDQEGERGFPTLELP